MEMQRYLVMYISKVMQIFQVFQITFFFLIGGAVEDVSLGQEATICGVSDVSNVKISSGFRLTSKMIRIV